MTWPACVHFMNAIRATVSATATAKATTCARLNAVPAARSTTEDSHGRMMRKSPVHITSAMFCSAVDRPTVVKICTLCEAWITPLMTST